MVNWNFLCKLTIGIPRLPCRLSLAKAVSSTVELVHLVTSDTLNLFNFAIRAFASKCLPIELVPCTDGWQRTWWQTIHILPGLPVSSIPQCKLNLHKGACRELFQGICRVEPTFIEAHQTSKIMCNVRSLKSRIKTCSFFEDTMTSDNEVFRDFVSDTTGGNWTVGNLIWVTVKGYVIVT